MKYIFFFFLFLFPYVTFANEKIDISVSQERISVGQDFEFVVKLELGDTNQGQISLEIPGIENFEVFSQGRSMEYQNINGEVSGTLIYTYLLSSTQEGNYSLGPVRFDIAGEEQIDDETLSIQIKNTINQISEKSSAVGGDDILGENTTEKNDIRDIREPRFFLFTLVFGVLFLFGLMYFFLQYILSRQSHLSEFQTVPQEEQNQVDPFFQEKQKLLNLKQKIGSMPSADFFQEYNSILREIFERYIGANALTGTLQELKSQKILYEQKLFGYFQRSYMYEYSQKDVSSETQHKYIDDSISLL